MSRRGAKTAVASVIRDLKGRAKQREARARSLTRELQKQERIRHRALFAIGRCLAEMLHERLYVNAGHADFSSYLKSLGFGRTQAFKLIAIVGGSTPSRVEAIGIEAAYRELRRRGTRGRR